MSSDVQNASAAGADLPYDGRTRSDRIIWTDIPSRMDRLPWSRWHWLVVMGLGITWVLDGLEVTIVGAIGSVLTEPHTLALSDAQVGAAGTAYLIGAVGGALLFGHLADRWGRKRLFMFTLGLYLIATVLTAFSANFVMFAIFRFFTGMGIGGEYSAINSAIDELIPARVRGWSDLAINGSWWLGTAVGAALTVVLLNPALIPHSIGWRLCFGLGALLGAVVLWMRRELPESPRWLMIHGRVDEAEAIVREIERKVQADTGLQRLPDPGPPIAIRPRGPVSIVEVATTMLKQYPQRSLLGFALMVGQAFLYNAVFFTYALVLTKFYHVPSGNVGLYLIPFAIGNILGTWTLGRLFDTIGRKPMITFTYVISGVLLAITGWLFQAGVLNAVTQTLCWCVIFFFASAGASSAYLTVSEVFPLETRAMAIAFFYAIGTLVGGTFAPLLFGALIGSGRPINVVYGYLLGAALMIAAGLVELKFGVSAERRSLESVAPPLSAAEAATVGSGATTVGSSKQGMGVWSPMPQLSEHRHDTELQSEAEAIGRAAMDQGPMSGEELRERVGARHWGPRRFPRALQSAQSQGMLRSTGRDTYDAPEHVHG
jgi:MFS family permease